MPSLNRFFSNWVTNSYNNKLSNAATIQSNLLRTLLAANVQTQYGKKYEFHRIKSVNDFKSALPIITYTDIIHSITQISQGEERVLTTGKVDYLQITSGTTSNEKLVPSTRRYQRAIRDALLVSYAFRESFSFGSPTHGRGIIFASTNQLSKSESGIPIGPASSKHLSELRPLWRMFSLIPFIVTQVPDPETRRYMYWRLGLPHKKINFMSAPFPASLLTLSRTLRIFSQDLMKDIADGTISNAIELPRQLRSVLERIVSKDPQRAKELNKIADLNNGLSPINIWQDLPWIITAHGSTFRSYEQAISQIFGQRRVWGTQYGASEGIIGFPWQSDDYRHLPALTASFLEFIPEEYWYDSNPETCLINELTQYEKYEVVLSGWNGMYRYRLGDIIEADGWFAGVPTFRIIGRQGGVISVVWEKTSEEHIVTAIANCIQNFDVNLIDFIVDIDKTCLPMRYRLWIELSEKSPYLPSLAENFDQELRKVNRIYDMLRGSSDIGSPTIKFLKKGAFETFRRMKKGYQDSNDQFKVLHTTNSPQYLSPLMGELLESGKKYPQD